MCDCVIDIVTVFTCEKSLVLERFSVREVDVKPSVMRTGTSTLKRQGCTKSLLRMTELIVSVRWYLDTCDTARGGAWRARRLSRLEVRLNALGPAARRAVLLDTAELEQVVARRRRLDKVVELDGPTARGDGVKELLNLGRLESQP